MEQYSNSNHYNYNYRLKCYHKYNYDTPNDATISDMISKERSPRPLKREPATDNLQVVGIQYGSGQDYKKPQRYEKSCERMKRIKELQAAEEDLRLHKERKNSEKEQEMAEKRKDLEMLKEYNPWGGVGGGAPRFTKSGTVLAQRLRFNQTPPKSSEATFDPFGKPGGGAPRRSDSGHIMTSLIADPNMRFQKQLKKEVERSLRYKPTNTITDKSIGGVATPRQSIFTQSELELKQKEQKQKEIYAHKLETQIQERPKTNTMKPPFIPYFPWGRDQVNRDISGKILPQKKREIPSIDVGAWLKGLGERKHHRVTPSAPTAGYNPWGKPGGGAPLIRRDGGTLTAVYGNFEDKNNQKEKSAVTSDGEAVVSTATWVGRGKVGQPPRDAKRGTITGGQLKQTSDITMHRLDIRRAPPTQEDPYHSQSNNITSQYETPYHKPSHKLPTRRRPEDMIKRL